MVLYYIRCIKFNRLITGFYDARIGEAVYGFSDQYEEEGGGTITILARSQIGDLTDMLKTFPQMTYNEYMYERSIAQIQFMATDNTHVKYLKDKDKRIWENYKEIIKSQTMLENLFASHRKIKNND